MILHCEFHTRDEAKEPLLFIHGMGSSSTAWKPLLNIPFVQNLESSFTVITIDLPGHGQTSMSPEQEMDPVSLAQAVLETMDSEGIERFHVVGNSLGGWIALEMAAMRPQRVLSIVGLAPAGLWLQPFTVRSPGTAVSKMIASSLKVVSPVLLRYEWARKIGFSDVSPRWRDFSYELCLDATNAMAKAAGYYPAWDSLLKKRFEKKIESSVPITIIFGDSDLTLPAETCQERSLVPSHSEWLIYENCGHAPMWDEPERIVEQIFATTGDRL
jgi:pimeloyl-ACP methyl ester carboxylesterase